MRHLFPGHYRPTVEFKDIAETAIFVFDTNVLLNFYALASTTRDQLFKLMRDVSSQCWIPYHVAMEFHKNRLKRLNDVLAEYKAIAPQISTLLNKAKGNCAAQDILRNDSRTSVLLNDLERAGSALIEHLTRCETLLPQRGASDSVADEMSEIFKENVGARPSSQDDLDRLVSDGQSRYNQKTPPGYSDNKKEETYVDAGLRYDAKYGDLIIWRQLLAYLATQSTNSQRHVMFITDDAKEDWWIVHDKDVIGPRPELVQELSISCPNWRLWMYKSSRFFEQLNAAVNKTAIQESVIEEVERAATKGQAAKPLEDLDVEHYMPSSHWQDYAEPTVRRGVVKTSHSHKGRTYRFISDGELMVSTRLAEDFVEYVTSKAPSSVASSLRPTRIVTNNGLACYDLRVLIGPLSEITDIVRQAVHELSWYETAVLILHVSDDDLHQYLDESRAIALNESKAIKALAIARQALAAALTGETEIEVRVSYYGPSFTVIQ